MRDIFSGTDCVIRMIYPIINPPRQDDMAGKPLSLSFNHGPLVKNDFLPLQL
jgi:hypothetical protein